MPVPDGGGLMATENQEYREQPIFGPVDDLRTEVKRLKLEVEALALAVGDIESFGKIQATTEVYLEGAKKNIEAQLRGK